MRSRPLVFPFCLSFFALLFAPLFFPTIRLVAFAPFLVFVFLRRPFFPSLWIATFCGLLVDLCNTDTRFGLFSLTYLVTASICYRINAYFFEDSPLSISLYTAFIASVFSIFQMIFLSFFHKSLPFNWQVAFTNFLFMPLLDALYAFIWFSSPLVLYTIFSGRKKGIRIR